MSKELSITITTDLTAVELDCLLIQECIDSEKCPEWLLEELLACVENVEPELRTEFVNGQVVVRAFSPPNLRELLSQMIRECGR